jgi:phosphoribosylformylglycinamidine cyclo-ligase
MTGMKYSEIVNYDELDHFKEEAMRRAAHTFRYPKRLGIHLLEDSVGSTAAVFELDDMPNTYVAFGVEGLGTKNMIAEIMAEKEKIGEGMGLSRRMLFAGIGQDEMAMTLNDLGAVGTMPAAFEPIHASGDSSYFTDDDVVQGLLDGYDAGAKIARVAIPGGETPTLKGIVYPKTLDIAGGSWGIIRPKSRLVLGQDMEAGLTIYGISSSGIHSNGVSLARRIAEKLKDGYFTKLTSGVTLGQALLGPTVIYTPVVEAMFDEGVDIRGMQPITGHGWAKIMRSRKQLRYEIENLPLPQDEFLLMKDAGPVENEEAYRAWNMGIGWVVFAPASNAASIFRVCRRFGLYSYELGSVENGEREVVMAPLNVTYRPK